MLGGSVRWYSTATGRDEKMSLNQTEKKQGKKIHTMTKTHLIADSFKFERLVKVGCDFITTGRVDGKRVYFLEQRGWGGQLKQSTTFTSLLELRRAIRR